MQDLKQDLILSWFWSLEVREKVSAPPGSVGGPPQCALLAGASVWPRLHVHRAFSLGGCLCATFPLCKDTSPWSMAPPFQGALSRLHWYQPPFHLRSHPDILGLVPQHVAAEGDAVQPMTMARCPCWPALSPGQRQAVGSPAPLCHQAGLSPTNSSHQMDRTGWAKVGLQL